MNTRSTRPDDPRPGGSPRLVRRSETRHEPGDLDKPVADTFAPPESTEINIAELQRMSMKELIAIAEQEQLTEYHGMKKQDLIFKILKERTRINGLMFGEGTLEILPDGFGFLRSPDYHYLPCPDDIYVLGFVPGPRSPDRFVHRKKTNGTSRYCESKRSMVKIRMNSQTKSSLTI